MGLIVIILVISVQLQHMAAHRRKCSTHGPMKVDGIVQVQSGNDLDVLLLQNWCKKICTRIVHRDSFCEMSWPRARPYKRIGGNPINEKKPLTFMNSMTHTEG